MLNKGVLVWSEKDTFGRYELFELIEHCGVQLECSAVGWKCCHWLTGCALSSS